MGVSVVCQECGLKFSNLRRELEGKLVKCKCGNKIRVPQSLAPVSTDLMQLPLPDATPAPAASTTSPPANYWPAPTKTVKKTRSRKEKLESAKSDARFRLVDVVYMVVGTIAMLGALASAFLLLTGFLSLLSPAANNIEVPAEVAAKFATENPSVNVTLIVALIETIGSIGLGVCGAFVVIYTMEKRQNRTSNHGWSLPAGAVAAAICILLSLVSYVVTVYQVSTYLDGGGIFGYALEHLMLTAISLIIPVAMILLYANRAKLDE